MPEMNPLNPRYRGILVPPAVYKASVTGFHDDPYVIGWKDGVNASRDAGVRDEPDGAPGPDGHSEKIHLDTAEDMNAVRFVIHLLQDDADKARLIVRKMSAPDRAVLSFYLHEASRLVLEEEDFRETADRRQARLSYGDGTEYAD